ncbi:hypothetical protein ACFIOY_13395 [Bradyrhizobium sp. TZ2]
MTSTTSGSRAPHIDGRHGGIQLRQFRKRKPAKVPILLQKLVEAGDEP